MTHQGFGFVEYNSAEDADYASKILNMIKLYGKPIRVNKASSGGPDRKDADIGATLFIGNLDPEVDEKMLYDTFSAFGNIVSFPKIARNSDTGESKGFAFISYDDFDASDAAIEGMNGQFLANKPVNVSYALKKDGKGERHGSAAGMFYPFANTGITSNQPRFNVSNFVIQKQNVFLLLKRKSKLLIYFQHPSTHPRSHNNHHLYHHPRT